ncbi:hypothetical protein CDL15_Pgr011013 [Punica granatum]|uniref:Uncharacterized protein n=1 Tax=Punica granatum TaxID=22663 RepID=A0A218XNE4_PUNGR|nr:hypothetical protein CDL15_Pgr011013 [Punica granatum]
MAGLLGGWVATCAGPERRSRRLAKIMKRRRRREAVRGGSGGSSGELRAERGAEGAEVRESRRMCGGRRENRDPNCGGSRSGAASVRTERAPGFREKSSCGPGLWETACELRDFFRDLPA